MSNLSCHSSLPDPQPWALPRKMREPSKTNGLPLSITYKFDPITHQKVLQETLCIDHLCQRFRNCKQSWQSSGIKMYQIDFSKVQGWNGGVERLPRRLGSAKSAQQPPRGNARAVGNVSNVSNVNVMLK